MYDADMSFVVREYREDDYRALVECLRGLQGFVHALDPLERLRAVHDFNAEAYTDSLLASVEKKRGKIFLSDHDGDVSGCVAGWVIPDEDVDLVSHHPSKTGRVFELFVGESRRGQKVGAGLMSSMEKYFADQGCDSVRLEVFSPNADAHAFYKKIGYDDRCVDMMKLLPKE